MTTSDTVFVAELGSNHNGEFGRATELIDLATDAGFDAIKFQYFRVAELYAPEVLARDAALRDRAGVEVPREWLAPLAERTRANGLRFGCSVFTPQGIEDVLPYVDFLKIASYSLPYTDLLRRAAATNVPLVLGTGMATHEEVVAALHVLQPVRVPRGRVTLLHCVSKYPTAINQCALSMIDALRWHDHVSVGWSDHSASPAVILRAVLKFGAVMVELHVDADRTGAEYDGGHCWLPGDAAEVIALIRDGQLADGHSSYKHPLLCEVAERSWRADPVDGMRPPRAARPEA